MQGAMLAGLTAGVAACTSENTSANSSSNDSEGVRNEPIKTEGMAAGIVLETLSHPLINYWGQTAKATAETFGIKATLQDGERNVEKQTSEMEALISQKVNFIVLQATDAAGLSPVVDKAEQAGIPVLTLNQDVATPHSCFVGMGHFAMGQQVAEGMAKQLGGRGSIVVIEGVQGTGANIQRLAGFKETLKSYPDMKIVASQSAAFDRKKGHDVMATILRGQSKIDGVFALNDEMAIGAGQAAIEAGRLTPGKLEMKIWGADGERDMFTSIQKGICAGVSAVDEKVIPQTLVFVAAWMMTAGMKGNQRAGQVIIPPFNVTAENVGSMPLPAA
jgi:ribose transport system substrate-binding protein/inositol transport system substrate-binding protein